MIQAAETYPQNSEVLVCIVIPNFNHGKELVETLRRLEYLSLPCLIIDDGSRRDTIEILKSLEETYDWVEVIFRKVNEGKGAAVCEGLRQAFRRGFTHALQIDADGQHNTEDIPLLLEKARENPEALVLAQPKFDKSAPLIRVIGRQFTRALVWLQTRSFRIQDALCGFRVYPLSSSVALLDSKAIGTRMEFDLEILVRLFWRGTHIINIPSLVRYQENGVSHFRYGTDNARIATTHLQLLWESLFTRKKKNTTCTEWANVEERGTVFALQLLVFLHGIVGNRIAYLLCYPVTLYFFLTGTKARLGSIDYLHTIFPDQEKKGTLSLLWLSFIHFNNFSQALVDKLASWSGRLDFLDVEWTNREMIRNVLERGTGAVVLSAHFGNLEVIRAASAFGGQVTINALMFTKNAQKYNRILKELNPDSHVNVIATEQVSSDLVLRLRESIAKGEVVTILADRVTVGAPSKTKAFPFLGRNAHFPSGPFLLAGMLNCPIFTLFCSKRGSDKYQVRVQPLGDSLDLKRSLREKSLEDAMREYVRRFEAEVRAAPLEWYNFYKFWENSSEN